MAIKSYLAALAVSTMVAAPVVAAPVSNPAASLSLSAPVRASTHVKHSNDLVGGFLIFALIAGAGAIAGIVVVATNSTSP